MDGQEPRRLSSRELNDILINQEKTIQLFKGIAQRIFAEPNDESNGDPEVEEATKYLTEQITVIGAESNIKRVFEHAESPIEHAFLNSVLLKMSFEDTLSASVYGPVDDLDVYMKDILGEYEGFVRWMGAFFYYRNKRSVFDAEAELKDWLNAGRMPEYAYRNSVQMLGAGLFDFVNSFHIMIQPSMKLKGKTIRPDLAIWVPADPTVKIIVECDGFDYHSDPKAFQRDRIRDRQVMEVGYSVRRYAGSEIYKDPIATGRELVDYLHSLPVAQRPKLQEAALEELASIEAERGPNQGE